MKLNPESIKKYYKFNDMTNSKATGRPYKFVRTEPRYIDNDSDNDSLLPI